MTGFEPADPTTRAGRFVPGRSMVRMVAVLVLNAGWGCNSGSTPTAPTSSSPGNMVPTANTGRRVLLGFNYLYDSQCGQVGFQAS